MPNSSRSLAKPECISAAADRAQARAIASAGQTPDAAPRDTRRSPASPRRRTRRRAGRAPCRSATLREDFARAIRPIERNALSRERECRASSSAPMGAATTTSSSCCRCRACTCVDRCLTTERSCPGFMMLSGSSARLMARMSSTAFAVFLHQHVELVPADSVLAGAGAAHGDRAERHVAGQRLGALALRARRSDRTGRSGESCRRRRDPRWAP